MGEASGVRVSLRAIYTTNYEPAGSIGSRRAHVNPLTGTMDPFVKVPRPDYTSDGTGREVRRAHCDLKHTLL